MRAPFATANDDPVARGTLTYLRTGVAYADFFLAVTGDRTPRCAVGDPVEVVVTDATQAAYTFRMTCYRVGVERGFWGVALSGGAGRLGRIIEPRYYQDAEGSKILSDALRECGERMSEATTLRDRLGSYVRRRGPAYQDIAALLACYPRATWRSLPDGSFWAGEETWPDAAEDVVVTARTPQFHRVLCEVEPALRCGEIVWEFTGRERSGAEKRVKLGGIERIVHTVTRVLRTELYITPEA